MVVLIKNGRNGIIAYMNKRCGIKINISEYTAVAEHILILGPYAVTVFSDLKRQKVVAALIQIVRNIETMRTVCVLAVSDRLTVYVKVITGFHTLKRNINSAIGTIKTVVYGEMFQIKACGICLGRTVGRSGNRRYCICASVDWKIKSL